MDQMDQTFSTAHWGELAWVPAGIS